MDNLKKLFDACVLFSDSAITDRVETFYEDAIAGAYTQASSPEGPTAGFDVVLDRKLRSRSKLHPCSKGKYCDPNDIVNHPRSSIKGLRS